MESIINMQTPAGQCGIVLLQRYRSRAMLNGSIINIKNRAANRISSIYIDTSSFGIHGYITGGIVCTGSVKDNEGIWRIGIRRRIANDDPLGIAARGNIQPVSWCLKRTIFRQSKV